MYFSILSTKLRVCLHGKSNLLNTRHRLLCYLPLVWVLTRVGQGKEACFKDGLWQFSNRSDTTTFYQLMIVNDGELIDSVLDSVRKPSLITAQNLQAILINFIWNGNWVLKISSQIVTVGFKSDSKASLLVCQSHPSLAVFSCFFEKQVQVYLEPLTLCRVWKTSNRGEGKAWLEFGFGERWCALRLLHQTVGRKTREWAEDP